MAVECASELDAAPTDCFEYFWNKQGEWVEEPNQRRGGESGVQRIQSSSGGLLYAKRQIGTFIAVGCTLSGDRRSCVSARLCKACACWT